MKSEKINEFLLFLRDIMLQNKDFILDYDIVYASLIRINVPERQKMLDLNELGIFNKWLKRYEKGKNTNCFIDPVNSYFCHFSIHKSEVDKENDYIKIYVPLDYYHIEKGANLLFDFLSENNINHVSKVSRKIRFDDVVIRLTNRQDADKLLDFIKNNKYINEGLIEASPFAFTKNKVALAVDGNVSFNGVVASFIMLYLNLRQKEKNFNKINYFDFYDFVYNYYNDVIIKDNQEILAKDFKKIITSTNFLDYKKVTELIIKCQSPNFTYEDYIKHLKYAKESFEMLNFENYYQTMSLLIHAVDIMAKNNNNDYNLALRLITHYLESKENDNYITRKENLREILYKFSFRKNMNAILKVENISLAQGYNKSMEIESIVPSTLEEVILESAIIKTYKVYDFEQVVYSLNQLITQNDYSGFTRRNLIRTILKDNVSSQKVCEIVLKNYQSENLDEAIINYVSDVLGKVSKYASKGTCKK